jgi:hypothetical protein
MFQKNVTNVAMTKVSGVSVQVSVDSRGGGRGRYLILRVLLVFVLVRVLVLGLLQIIHLTPDTRHLKPTYSGYFFRIR